MDINVILSLIIHKIPFCKGQNYVQDIVEAHIPK